MDNKFLLDESLPNICITKNNFIYWDDSMDIEDKYDSFIVLCKYFLEKTYIGELRIKGYRVILIPAKKVMAILFKIQQGKA